MRLNRWIGVAVLLGAFVTAGAAEPMPDFLGERKPRAKLLLLGTFHFRDAGLDAHKPKHGFDAMSEQRQKEIGAVLKMLAAFKPTKIGVEMKPHRQGDLDASYAEYLAGKKELSANEIYQIGFRLGHMLGHEKLYAIDAAGRSYFPDMSQEEFEKKVGSMIAGVDPKRVEAEEALEAQFMKMYDWEDAQLDGQSLQETLLFLNDPELLLRHHGHYLIGSFKLGEGDDYFGVDMGTNWYNRNLRIFQNLQRITESREERILVVIGAGHVPILRHSALASPDYELVEVDSVIKNRDR